MGAGEWTNTSCVWVWGGVRGRVSGPRTIRLQTCMTMTKTNPYKTRFRWLGF